MRRLVGIGVAICVLFSGAADAALIRTGNLVLTADGGFTPRKLPRRRFIPIDFKGDVDLRAVDGTVPPPLLRAVVDFDRDGRIGAGGLASCDPAALAEATVAAGRAICRRAVVGVGHVGALIPRDGAAALAVKSGLTLFNGPREAGHPTAIVHARLGGPAPQTFVVVVPILKRRGEFRYRAVLDAPQIAGGRGVLTHVDLRIGRRYRYGGKKRSYTSARCRDGILRTHGRFTFADPEATIIDGSVEKACTPR